MQMEIYSTPLIRHSLPHSSLAGTFISGHHLRPVPRPNKLSWSTTINVPQSSWRYDNKPIPESSRSSFNISPTALGSNVSEDTDDMYDDLFEKYGKVVYTRNDQKSARAEIDDDAESLSFAVAVAKVANEVKAGDIKVLFVKPLVYWTRFFIIATAFSRPQVDAIGTKIRHMAEEKYGRTATGDYKPNSWTLLDFGDAVVHIFLPEQREYYNLEEFYANATSIDLPFESQQPFRG